MPTVPKILHVVYGVQVHTVGHEADDAHVDRSGKSTMTAPTRYQRQPVGPRGAARLDVALESGHQLGFQKSQGRTRLAAMFIDRTFTAARDSGDTLGVALGVAGTGFGRG